jgi:uncharacterized protein
MHLQKKQRMIRMHVKLAIGLLLFGQITLLRAQKIGDPYPKDSKLIEEGISLFDNGEYERSIANYLQVNPNDSFYSNALHELSLSYMQAKKYKLAAESALKGLNLNNENRRDFLILYANALDELENIDSALATYRMGLKEFPYFSRYYYEIGILYLKQKKYDLALTAFTESIKSNPFHPASHYRIGFLAAEAKQPALSLLAFQTYLTLISGGENTNYAVGVMEKVGKNEYSDEYDVPTTLFQTQDLNEVNDIILSKAAFSKAYKSKIKSLDYWIIKQVQVTIEKSPKDYSSENWLTNFYINYYNELWKKNHFEGMMVSSLSGLNSKDILKAVKADQVKISEFATWANKYLSNIRNDKEVMLDQKLCKTELWYDGMTLYAMGASDNNDKRTGFWQYYSSGHKSAEGKFVAGEKVGKWNYYYYNGMLKSTEIYDEQHKANGPYASFFDNGAQREKSTYKDDLLDGETIIYNANGTINSKFTYTNGKRNGIRYNYTSYGLLKNEGNLKDNVYTGSYKSYHNNGKVDMECQTANDDIEGPVTYRHRNGKLRSKGTFTKGKRTGNWKWYDESEKIESEGDYIDGKETGVWKWYYKNGQLKEEAPYENGKLKGIGKLYDENGKVWSESVFKNGKVDSYKIFDTNGGIITQQKTSGGKIAVVYYNQFRQKTSEGQLLNGLEQGVWKYYYPNGELKYERSYDKGNSDGSFKYFYKNGKLYYEINYVNNNREGYYKSYFLNGKVRSEGYYLNDEQHGPWTFYSSDGSLDEVNFFQEGEVKGITESYLPGNKLYSHAIYKNGFYNNSIRFDTSGKAYDTTRLILGTGKLVTIDPLKQITFTANYVGGKKNGTTKSYYGAGKLSAVDSFYMGNREGAYKAYHINGKLKIHGFYLNDEKDSIWNYYDEDGILYRSIRYEKGESNGPDKSYNNLGKLEVEKTYKDDERHGDYIYYGYDGTIIYKAAYVNGVLMSYTSLDKEGKLKPISPVANETATIETFYPSGNKAISFKIEKGYLQGPYIVYYPNGKIQELKTFKDGDYHGVVEFYYPNGTLKNHKEYQDDELVGVEIDYYDNGVIAKKTPYLLDYRHGDVKHFDKTGKLIKTETFVYGIIQK